MFPAIMPWPVTLCCLLPPALVLPHCSPTPDLMCCHCPPPLSSSVLLSSAAAIFRHRYNHHHSPVSNLSTALLVTADVAPQWQSLIAAIVTFHLPVPLTLACSPCHLLPQSASAHCCWTPLVLPYTFRCLLLCCRQQMSHPDQTTTVNCDGIIVP